MAAVSLGLPGFVVLAGADYGELELLIETTDRATGCPDCVVVATLHDRKPRWCVTWPLVGGRCGWSGSSGVWRCEEPLCATRTWTETSPAIAPRAVLTKRARVEIARRVGQDATDVARVAVALGVSWPTAMRAVRDYGQRMLAEAAAGRIGVGLDRDHQFAVTGSHIEHNASRPGEHRIGPGTPAHTRTTPIVIHVGVFNRSAAWSLTILKTPPVTAAYATPDNSPTLRSEEPS